MNILVECFWYEESGPYFTYGFIKGLLENGVNVYVITTDIMENLEDWKKIIPDEKMYLWRELPRHNKPFSFIFHLLQAGFKFKNVNFDYIISTFPRRSDTIINRFIKHKEDMMLLHDVIPHSSTKKSTTDYQYKYIQKADNILVLTKKNIEDIQKLFNYDKKNIFYMRHGLMPYSHHNIRFNDDNKINFLYFGRIAGYKGLKTLAKAYSCLSEKYKNITLRVVGRGDFSPYEHCYTGLLNTTIINKYIADKEIATYFEYPNTVLILPYSDATQSGVLGIAYEFEVPVIASNLIGLKEQLFDGTVGLLFPANDSLALETEMEKFLVDNNTMIKQISLMKKYKEKMTWKYVTNELLCQIYERKI